MLVEQRLFVREQCPGIVEPRLFDQDLALGDGGLGGGDGHVAERLLSRWGGGDDVSDMYRRMQDNEGAERTASNRGVEGTPNPAERAGNNLNSTPGADVRPTEVNAMRDVTESIGPAPDELLNNDAEDSSSGIGRGLVGPTAPVEPVKPVFHVVAKGETLGAIPDQPEGLP